ncbi:MAG: BrnT family toxin [Parvibaculaceae bacterium]
MTATARFEWDENKNRANQRKHGVSFEEAAQVFLDPLHVSVQDRTEDGELRWRTCGLTAGFVLLVVAHTAIEHDEDGQAVEVIRIISARRADRKERRRYEEENG